MDPVGGLQALENLRQAGNEKGRMFVVPNAGHHGKDTVQHNVLRLICMYLSRQYTSTTQPQRTIYSSRSSILLISSNDTFEQSI